ncbi:MAG TPA: HU family DNA-binding protein [candidate division Zixibacteria bacterium]|jgi:DNA-binding protein HU-beta
MKREEMIEKISKEAKVNKAQAERAMKALFDGVATSLKKGQKVTFVGFGTFSISKRKARMGRNPRTGEQIKIAAAKVPHFKAGEQLKRSVR